MNPEKVIIKLLSGKLSYEEYNYLENFIKKILIETIKSLFAKSNNYQIQKQLIRIYGDDYISCLVQEYILMLLSNKRHFLKLEYISEKYLKICAKNLIIYLLTKKETAICKQVCFHELINQKNDLLESEEEVRIEEIIASEVQMNYLDRLCLESLVDVLKKRLTDKEIETLCAYLEKILYEKKGLEKSKRDVYYKRWERLKPKLQEIFQDYLQELLTSKEEGISLILSELCQKND